MGNRTSLNLDCKIVSPESLIDSQIQQMYSLMEENYLGMEFPSFCSDLMEKTKVFLFHKEETIQGFTTLKLKTQEIENQTIQIAYSGDTVLSKKFRGTLSIPIYWGRYMLEVSKEEIPLYWLLTSKGFRTYRYLSVFFKVFYPNPLIENESLKRYRDLIASLQFGEEFNKQTGILKRKKQVQTIRDLDSEEIAITHTKDPYIQYFVSQNKNYHLGEELVCLAPFSKSNIIPIIYRYLLSKHES
ncbi:hypothetical protein EHQ59_05695 [Leptospira kemamanensis]|uniref:GNAT family N-acetyltransferase n=1 Tax=Leptospira kemamanensis TaxID=2484942 RepID=A0A4V3JQF9_9LEPT|nr:hypothetical protein [Leptospira kemamanensis]TGL55100.1 hypothetical protein EHQ59_05695 [Leptospira kemamanensis]